MKLIKNFFKIIWKNIFKINYNLIHWIKILIIKNMILKKLIVSNLVVKFLGIKENLFYWFLIKQLIKKFLNNF